MKSLTVLALILVFVLALPAPATVELHIDDSKAPSTAALVSGETIQVYSSDSSVWDGYVFIAPGASGGALVNGRKGPAYSGDMGGFGDPYPYYYPYLGYHMWADYLTDPPEPGYQFLIDLTGNVGDTGTVNLYLGPSYSVIAQGFDYTIVPEPLTISLLALGGLAVLTKRKK